MKKWITHDLLPMIFFNLIYTKVLLVMLLVLINSVEILAEEHPFVGQRVDSAVMGTTNAFIEHGGQGTVETTTSIFKSVYGWFGDKVNLDGDESRLFQLSHSPAVISTLFFTIQRDAHGNSFSWEIYDVILQMIYGGDRSLDYSILCPLEIISADSYLMVLGFVRILTALLWKQLPWKPSWRKKMYGEVFFRSSIKSMILYASNILIVSVVFLSRHRELLPESSSILISRRRQVTDSSPTTFELNLFVNVMLSAFWSFIEKVIDEGGK